MTTVLAFVAMCAAEAQIALPPVQTPRLPPVNLPVDVNKTLGDVTQTLDPQKLVDLRQLRVRSLLREHRQVLEADPRGAPIVRAEVVAFSPSADALTRAQTAGFAVAREQVLEGLEARIVVLRAPPRMSTREALKKLRALDKEGTYDFNHVYSESGVVAGDEEKHPTSPQYSATAPGVALPPASLQSSFPRERGAEGGLKVGLIDGGVDVTHPVFAGKNIHAYGCNGQPVPSAHGTAVASLLVGEAGEFQGVIPDAELYAADVYCGQPTGGAVDSIAAAFAWLSREKVGVINVSLVGPANSMLENIIRLISARGHLVVAAVGNDGPNAPPLYPAAYPGVVGVTGVDRRHRVLLEALRGKQVDFAAQGADISAAGASRSFVPVRGTSFAAPMVTGLLAFLSLPPPDKTTAEGALQRLDALAWDLGAKGPDPVYGRGFVTLPVRRIAVK